MGNVCSSGQKKSKKDDISEKSEDSPSYQPASKTRNSKESNDNKIAPLADPEPISDISGCQNSSFVTNLSTNGHVNRNAKMTSVSDSISSTPHSATAPTDLSSSKSLPYNLLGLQGKPKTTRRIERDKKIVIYVLATDCDQQIEKLMLHKLYPILSERCAYRGFEIIISDSHDTIEDSNLRAKILDVRNWSETPLEARGGHEEAANCLAEITRHTNFSYVIPVLFLGTSLGRPLLPLTIESQDFTSALNLADESIKSLMEKWYIFDNASQPVCYRLNTNDVFKNPIETNKQLEELLLGLVNVFSKELRDSYLTTVVEQEINNTILMSQELSKRCLWVQTGIIPPKLPDNPTSLESEVNRRLTNIHSELRNQLSEKNLIRIPPTIQIPDDQLSSIIESLLNTIIDGIVDEHSMKFAIPKCTYGVDRRLLEDVEIVAQYSKMLGQNCANFSILEDIKDYIVGESCAPLVVYGGIGSGKSVLTSKIMNNIHSWMPECNLIVRYVNLTDISSDYSSLVGSIAEQLSVLSNGEPCRTLHTFEAYVEFIKNILENIKLYITIVIDSLDEITNFINLSWLPKKLLPNIKVIFTTSTSESSKTNQFMEELRRIDVHSGNFMELVYFSDEQWKDVLSFGGGDFYAANGALQLPENWQNCPQKSPLQAKVLWWLAWLGIYELDDISTDAIINKMIDIIETKIKAEYVQFLLTLLVINKNGIRESDCLAIFQNANSLNSIMAYKIWYTFCWLMGPMLLHMRKVQIIDKLLKMTILKRYEHKLTQFHQMISDHFINQNSKFTDQKEKFCCYNEEKFLKLPYHNYMTIDKNSQTDLQSFYNTIYFTELEWYHNKLMATGCVQILNDISLVENHLKLINKQYEAPQHIQLVKQFLRNHIRELNYDGGQFYSLFKVFLRKSVKNDSTLEENVIIGNWLEYLMNMKQTYLEPNNYFEICEEPSSFSVFGSKMLPSGFDAIVNLTHKGNFVASISTERSEICVWDVPNCKRVRTLTGVTQPTLLVPVGDYEVAVLCKREIKVLNLDDGKFKVTLKGVMNQKMPYFGLHDSKHLVCLSRNRMYVNLMNLESGDCVTTFKAGEDRFLNSLLVSGDGRILVCGDETQKPFPLLVWHLSQRKLLYDLRIPHHDFITTLSAITYEGSYVCVVAKELNEPTPNFIVVYDLQSGTLFKKWKPSCNTVSLAISQSNACVIAGLDDARILIWDLVTGNCKYTLIGHNAPVTFLKLDPLGKILLSGDKDGRDLSIRLWELETGKSLAVYTPKRKILACEILPNGKFVVLALENLRNLTTLVVRNIKDNELSDDINVKYGTTQNDGKTFELDKDSS